MFRYGLLGLSSFRRTAFVGPRQAGLDVVDDVKKHGRKGFLVESHIDLKKGKAFDAHIQRPRIFGDDNFSQPTGGRAPGGVHGRRGEVGVKSQPTFLRGITKQRITKANIRNQY